MVHASVLKVGEGQLVNDQDAQVLVLIVQIMGNVMQRRMSVSVMMDGQEKDVICRTVLENQIVMPEVSYLDELVMILWLVQLEGKSLQIFRTFS